MNTMTIKELRIAEMAVSLVRGRINTHMDRCTYCDHGHNAYDQADHAVSAAFKDVQNSFDKIRREIAEGGS